METDHITLIIIAVFALVALLLMLMRALMEDVARTVRTWRKLRDTMRRGKGDRQRRRQPGERGK